MYQTFTGFQKVKLLSINPDQRWLQNNLSIEEVPEYIWEDRQKIKHCLIDVYFQDSRDNVFKSQIYLKDELKQGKSNNFLYVNQIGDNQWVTNEEQLFDSFKQWEKIITWGINGQPLDKYKPGATPLEKEVLAKKQYHIAIDGEEVLLQLLKNYYNNSPYDTDVNIFIDVQPFFEGDFSSLQKLVDITTDYNLTIFTYLSKKLEQKVLNFYFPLVFFRDVTNNMQISNTFKKQYNEFLKKLEYTDGYWEICKFKEFQPEVKNVEETDSDY